LFDHVTRAKIEKYPEFISEKDLTSIWPFRLFYFLVFLFFATNEKTPRRTRSNTSLHNFYSPKAPRLCIKGDELFNALKDNNFNKLKKT